jgi:hypothetical protein
VEKIKKADIIAMCLSCGRQYYLRHLRYRCFRGFNQEGDWNGDFLVFGLLEGFLVGSGF